MVIAPAIRVLYTWITIHLPAPEGWKAELFVKLAHCTFTDDYDDVLIAVPLEGDALTESKVPRIIDKLILQTVDEADTATFECRFASPVQPQV